MNKTYLIIGGSSGIGEEISMNLIDNGNVISTYNKNEKSSQSSVKYIHFDILGEQTLDLDVDQLDGLVYCPGTINLKPFHRLTEKDFVKDFEINLMGAVKVIQQCLPLLKKSDHGSIVLFSTVAVQQGMSFHSSVAASKGAVEGLTRSLAAELAPKIRVNTIAPSIVNTPLAERLLNNEEKIKASEKRHPLHKIGHPKDIAAMAEFLLSEKSAWITGQVMKVDGGMSSVKML